MAEPEQPPLRRGLALTDKDWQLLREQHVRYQVNAHNGTITACLPGGRTGNGNTLPRALDDLGVTFSANA